jgi:hypothetical protein
LRLSELQADIDEKKALIHEQREWWTEHPGKQTMPCCGGSSYHEEGRGGSASHARWCYPLMHRVEIMINELEQELEFRIAARQYARRL